MLYGIDSSINLAGGSKKEVYADESTADRIVIALAGNPIQGKARF